MTAADVAEASAVVAGLRAELAALAEQATALREAVGLTAEEIRVVRRLGYREGLDAREDRAASARAAERRATFTVLPGGAA